MKRGEIWTASGGSRYTGKPRPVVVIQDDRFDANDSITICAFTTDELVAPLFRLPVEPSDLNGLRAASRLMVDKIASLPRSRIGTRIGRLAEDDLLRLNRAIIVFLGLAQSPGAKRKVRPRRSTATQGNNAADRRAAETPIPRIRASSGPVASARRGLR